METDRFPGTRKVIPTDLGAPCDLQTEVEMKSIIAVDGAETYKPALNLYCRLKFGGVETELVNAVDIVLPYTAFAIPITAQPTGTITESLRQAGKAILHRAQSEAEAHGISVTTKLLTGPAAGTLLQEAEKQSASLVVVGSQRKGALMAFFSGSVSRALTSHSDKSILIGKEGVKESGPVEAVLATDHSDYANKAIDLFLAMNAEGISKIHVVTAYEISDFEAQVLESELPALDLHVDKWIESKLREKSHALVERLKKRGIDADCVVAKGPPNDLIAETMKRTHSELLILGAQGHGFFERLSLGSVSFHQVVAEPHSVLVLRPE